MNLFMADFQLTTPVAFLIFNRPDTTARVFEAIRQAKPPKLLVVADGPRPDRPDDVEKCKAARAVIERVDWNCQVLKNYSDVNLGCGKRPATGITWVFEQVEEAIIFEDDCLPHMSFFRYCEELLKYYRNDQRIMFISGNNFQLGRQRTSYSYYFSRYPTCWGWATWKRAWQYFDLDIQLWEEVRDGNMFKYIFTNHRSMKYWKKIYNQSRYDIQNGTLHWWDYLWFFACWVQSGLAIVPNVNLVRNIGFGPNATHTLDRKSRLNINAQEMSFPLKHPPYIIPNIEADNFVYNFYFNTPLLSRLFKKIISSLSL